MLQFLNVWKVILIFFFFTIQFDIYIICSYHLGYVKSHK